MRLGREMTAARRKASQLIGLVVSPLKRFNRAASPNGMPMGLTGAITKADNLRNTAVGQKGPTARLGKSGIRILAANWSFF